VDSVLSDRQTAPADRERETDDADAGGNVHGGYESNWNRIRWWKCVGGECGFEYVVEVLARHTTL
jgi:hypothetical protein